MFNFLRNYGVQKIAIAEKLIRSFNEFEKKFPNEEDSVEYFAKLVINELGVNCRFCSSSSIQRSYGSRIFLCLECRSKGWIFSGTFFQKMRVAKLWNATIWLYERRIEFNAWQLAELCRVAYSSALMISRKIAKIIFSVSDQDFDFIPSGTFLVLFRKRSIETPARAHPRSEQKILDEAVSDSCKEEEVFIEKIESENSIGISSLSDLEKQVFDLLGEIPVHFDDLCRRLLLPGGNMSAVLVALELNDLIVRKGGDFYVRKSQLIMAI